MKKYCILPIAIILLMASGSSYAQQKAGAEARSGSQQAINTSVLSGFFEVAKPNKVRGIVEHINVNYAISPAPFTNALNLELSTPDPVIFSAYIIDVNGKKLMEWKAKSQSHVHNTQLDISKLASGSYKVNIYWQKSEGLLYSIPFQKEG